MIAVATVNNAGVAALVGALNAFANTGYAQSGALPRTGDTPRPVAPAFLKRLPSSFPLRGADGTTPSDPPFQSSARGQPPGQPQPGGFDVDIVRVAASERGDFTISGSARPIVAARPAASFELGWAQFLWQAYNYCANPGLAAIGSVLIRNTGLVPLVLLHPVVVSRPALPPPLGPQPPDSFILRSPNIEVMTPPGRGGVGWEEAPISTDSPIRGAVLLYYSIPPGETREVMIRYDGIDAIAIRSRPTLRTMATRALLFGGFGARQVSYGTFAELFGDPPSDEVLASGCPPLGMGGGAGKPGATVSAKANFLSMLGPSRQRAKAVPTQRPRVADVAPDLALRDGNSSFRTLTHRSPNWSGAVGDQWTLGHTDSSREALIRGARTLPARRGIQRLICR